MNILSERLDKAEELIKKPSFRQNKGLGNEVGYYVFDYPAECELEVRERVEYIRKKNENSPDGFRVVVYDLYDLIIQILKDKGYLEQTIAFEKTKGFDKMEKAIISMLRPTTADSLIIKYVKEHTPDNSVIFLTGIGKCYPILRAHVVLNTMHQIIDNVPVVLFYPGKYSEQNLLLFGEIADGNYYRAFKLVD